MSEEKKTGKEKKFKEERKKVKEEVKGVKEEKAGKKVSAASKEELDKKRLELTGNLRVFEVIEYPLITEKAVNMIEAENKLCFIVNKKARKQDVRKAVESLYDVKVDGVNILKDMKSRKRAIVKVNKAFKAEEIATKLGVL